MTRSKLSSKVLLLVGGIGLSVAAFAGQPAAAQEYCADGLVPDPTWGYTDYYPDYSYYGYLPYGGYGWHRDGRGMGGAVGVDRGFSAAHYGGGGFAHGMGGGFHGGGFGGGGHR